MSTERRKETMRCAMEEAGFLSTLFMTFNYDLLKRGALKPLTLEDLDRLPSTDTPLATKHVLAQYNQQTDGLVVWPLFKAFRRRWAIAASSHSTWIACTVYLPYMIRSLVQFYVDKTISVWYGILYAGVAVLLILVSSIAVNQRFYQVSLLCIRF